MEISFAKLSAYADGHINPRELLRLWNPLNSSLINSVVHVDSSWTSHLHRQKEPVWALMAKECHCERLLLCLSQKTKWEHFYGVYSVSKVCWGLNITVNWIQCHKIRQCENLEKKSPADNIYTNWLMRIKQWKTKKSLKGYKKIAHNL